MSGIQPVIVLGMHRSGTSLMTKVVERCGIFMGAVQEKNNEAVYFINLNEWMFRHLNATWDGPRNAMFYDEQIGDYLAKALALKLNEQSRVHYLGQERVAQYPDMRMLDFRWGWKDPRNTWTADIWMRLFPGAKLVHVYRHPVDVAASLRHREQQHAEYVQKFIAEQGMLAFLTQGYRFQMSGRSKLLQEGFGLWVEYVSQALEVGKKFPDNFLSICYEELLAHPEEKLAEIGRFLDVSEENMKSSGLHDMVRSQRGLAFRERPELVEFHRTISDHPLVRELGYN